MADPVEVTVSTPFEFVADISVDRVAPIDGSISNPPRGGAFGSGSLADLDDVNYLHLWGTHRFQNMPPGLDQFAYSLPAMLPATGVVSVLSATLTFQAKLLDFADGIVVLRDTGTEMAYTDWEGTPEARMYTYGGQATAQDMHFVFDEVPAFDLFHEVNTFAYAPSVITLNPTMLDWSTAHPLTIFAWDGNATNIPTAQLRLTQAFVTITYTYAEPDVTPAAITRGQRVTPSLRMLQRGGSGGMSGIPRMVGDPTRRGIRQGPGSIY